MWCGSLSGVLLVLLINLMTRDNTRWSYLTSFLLLLTIFVIPILTAGLYRAGDIDGKW